jgi:DNA repair photolyase
MSKTLKILSRPKGNAEEYGRWSVNPYIGCSNLCSYCFLKKGPSGAYLGQGAPVLKKGVVNEDHAYHLAMAEIYANYEEIIRDGGLFMTFTSDPCVEETQETFFQIALDSAGYLGIPVMFLTKSADFINFWRYTNIVSGMICRGREIKRLLAFGWTLTGHDELEPNASPNDKRINAMRLVSANGFKTWASIEPVIDFDASYRMIQQALDAGCQHFKIGLLTNNTHVVRKDFSFGEHQFKAYDVIDCMHFIEDVMRLTEGKATVYWKQSVRDLLETIYTPAAVDELLNFPHSVGKDWSIFKKEG